MLKVLSTKQLNADVIKKSSSMDMALTCVDFIRIHPIDFDISALMSVIYDAMAFTSSNAVKCFFENPNIEASHWTKPIYALSGKTKDELAKYGLTPIAMADNAAELSAAILANGSIRSVLQICGNLSLDTLETKLLLGGISYVSLEVYETLLAPIDLTENYDAVMFYSPSGVDSFIAKNDLNPDTLYCCIGETTATKLKSINTDLDIILPKQPSPDGMLAAIRDFKKQHIT